MLFQIYLPFEKSQLENTFGFTEIHVDLTQPYFHVELHTFWRLPALFLCA